MDEMILEFRQAEVNLNGRKFLLKEMPAKQLREYRKLVELITSNDPEISAEKKDTQIMTSLAKILIPVDSVFENQDEIIRYLDAVLTPRFLVKIIEIQNQLNRIDDFDDDKKK